MVFPDCVFECHIEVKANSNLSSTQNYLSNKYQHDYISIKKILIKFYPSAKKVLTFEPLATRKVEVIQFFLWFCIISYPVATFKMVAQVF